MSNFNASVCLSELKGAFVMDVEGQTSTQKCVCLPIQLADLQVGNNGKIYLNMVAWELKSMGQYGNTHMLKQSLTKERREELGEAVRDMKILGNLKPMTAQIQGDMQGIPVYKAPMSNNEEVPF